LPGGVGEMGSGSLFTFGILLSVMVLIGVGMFFYLRHRKWI